MESVDEKGNEKEELEYEDDTELKKKLEYLQNWGKERMVQIDVSTLELVNGLIKENKDSGNILIMQNQESGSDDSLIGKCFKDAFDGKAKGLIVVSTNDLIGQKDWQFPETTHLISQNQVFDEKKCLIDYEKIEEQQLLTTNHGCDIVLYREEKVFDTSKSGQFTMVKPITIGKAVEKGDTCYIVGFDGSKSGNMIARRSMVIDIDVKGHYFWLDSVSSRGACGSAIVRLCKKDGKYVAALVGLLLDHSKHDMIPRCVSLGRGTDIFNYKLESVFGIKLIDKMSQFKPRSKEQVHRNNHDKMKALLTKFGFSKIKDITIDDLNDCDTNGAAIEESEAKMQPKKDEHGWYKHGDIMKRESKFEYGGSVRDSSKFQSILGKRGFAQLYEM